MERDSPNELSVMSMNRNLDRWKIEWDFAIGELSHQEVQNAGFAKDAGIEYWYLAKSLLEKSKELRGERFGIRSALPGDSTRSLKDLIKNIE